MFSSIAELTGSIIRIVEGSTLVVKTGLEVCLDSPPEILRNARFGLLLNQASVDRSFRYASDVLAERFPGQLRALFTPQHGLWGEQQANMIETPHGRHRRLDLPIYSLYSDMRRPTPEQLADLDCLVIDLQDVGTRVYTFIWTISHCLEACAEVGIPMVILDRPNPLGGDVVEGPILDPEYTSFVGRSGIPTRHGLTLAELAAVVNDQLQLGAQIVPVKMEGWHRNQLWDETGLRWIAPSPNLPTPAGVELYPGQVLLEGTNLSEGRGTTTPFEVIGAPFIDPEALLQAILPFECPGIVFRPIYFQPTFDKWLGVSCGGLYLHTIDAHKLRSYYTTLALLACIRNLYPDEFRWLQPPYEYETEKMPIDILTGNSRTREVFDGNRLHFRAQEQQSVWVQDASKRETLDNAGQLTPGDVARLSATDIAGWQAISGKHRLYS